MKTRYTWKYVITTLATQVIDRKLVSQIKLGAHVLGEALLTVLVRLILLILFPITAPIIVYVMRRLEREHESDRERRQKAMDADI